MNIWLWVNISVSILPGLFLAYMLYAGYSSSQATREQVIPAFAGMVGSTALAAVLWAVYGLVRWLG